MRRGLIAWWKDEMPAPVFAGRVAAIATALKEAELSALLVYADFTRTAGVARLTHFIPYWGRSILLVTPGAEAILFTTNNKRSESWIREVSCISELVCTLDLGSAVAGRLGPESRIGVVESTGFPADILKSIRSAHPHIAVSEAAVLFEKALGAGAGQSAAIWERVSTIAEAGLRAGLEAGRSGDANLAVAAAERVCRLEGAEEVLISIAPDMRHDPTLRRIEGPVSLASVFALHLSVAYKGAWLRSADMGAREEMPGWATRTASRMDVVLQRPGFAQEPEASIREAIADDPRASLEYWRIEGEKGNLPLALLAGSGHAGQVPQGEGLRSFSCRIKLDEGWWLCATPLTR